MKKTTIYFDLDGTLFDLYGKTNWLDFLENEKSGIFIEGNFMPNIEIGKLLELISKLLSYGVNFEVITWLPKQASKNYEEICEKEKRIWVEKNLPFIQKINCQSYGIPKQKAINQKTSRMILIDDNEDICRNWETKIQRKFYKVDKSFSAVNALQDLLSKIEGGEWA